MDDARAFFSRCRRLAPAVALPVLAFLLHACGPTHPTLNEYEVLEAPPLTIPPDFSLRPPPDGAPPQRPGAAPPADRNSGEGPGAIRPLPEEAR